MICNGLNSSKSKNTSNRSKEIKNTEIMTTTTIDKQLTEARNKDIQETLFMIPILVIHSEDSVTAQNNTYAFMSISNLMTAQEVKKRFAETFRKQYGIDYSQSEMSISVTLPNKKYRSCGPLDLMELYNIDSSTCLEIRIEKYILPSEANSELIPSYQGVTNDQVLKLNKCYEKYRKQISTN